MWQTDMRSSRSAASWRDSLGDRIRHDFLGPTSTADPAVLALEADWQTWLRTLFPRFTSYADGVPVPFAAHHGQFWEWLWAIERGVRPDAFFGIWPRGGAKSTSAELGVVALGARRRRRYGWYVSETQDQADEHVGTNIASMLESTAVEQFYPDLADRQVGKYGNQGGWRRNRLRTRQGFTVDALGLDVAARGKKLEEQRPDFIVLDDIDGELDTAATTEKKIAIITRKLLPAGAPDLAVLGIQNLVIEHGVFGQVVQGRADFLRRRIVAGPVPAVHDLEVEQDAEGYRVVGGTPTWAGQDLDVCEEQINDWGLSAFLQEAQHEVQAPAGGMFDHLTFRRCTWEEVPWSELIVTVLWVDPAVTKKDRSDSHGIQVDAIATDGTIYRFFSWEQRATPRESLRRAILKALELNASYIGIETDQGGDTWQDVYWAAWQSLVAEGEISPDRSLLPFREEKAGSGHDPKAHRAQQMLVDYEQGRIVHVMGTHTTLEQALRRFPLTPPLDLVDAAYWSWADLRRYRPIDRQAWRAIVVNPAPHLAQHRQDRWRMLQVR